MIRRIHELFLVIISRRCLISSVAGAAGGSAPGGPSLSHVGARQAAMSTRPPLRQLAAAALILVMIILAADANRYWMQEEGKLNSFLLFVTFYFFCAAVYFLGFFCFLPDLLDGVVRVPGTRRQRWSAWLQWSGLLTIVWASVIGYFQLASLSPSDRTTTLLFGIPLMYCAAAVVVALQRYTSALPDTPSSIPDRTLRVPFTSLFRWLGAPAHCLISALKPRVSIPSGSALVLASVLLVTSADFSCGGQSYRGHQILTGEGSWLTAQQIKDADILNLTFYRGMLHFVLRLVGWAQYAMAMAVALSGVVVLIFLRGERPSRAVLVRVLAVCSSMAALFTISDLTFFWFAMSAGHELLLWFIYWLIPAMLLIERRHRPPKWQASIIPLLAVLFLPIVFFSFGVLILLEAAVPGFTGYYLGILALWWGYAQLAEPALRT
jgi:hypothetical protein